MTSSLCDVVHVLVCRTNLQCRSIYVRYVMCVRACVCVCSVARPVSNCDFVYLCVQFTDKRLHRTFTY